MFSLSKSRKPFEPDFGEWRDEPWAHMVSTKTYTRSTYRKLRDYFPPPEWTQASPTNYPLKESIGSYDLVWERFLRVSPPWSEYYEYLCGVRFYDHVMSKVGRWLEKTHPHLDFFYNSMIRPDMYFFRFLPGMSLELHRDSPLHVISWVNYFDAPKGGQFVLGDDNRPRHYSPKENMSIMWPNDGHSWHGVTEIMTPRCICYIALNHRDDVWKPHWDLHPDRPALPPRSEFKKAINAPSFSQAL